MPTEDTTTTEAPWSEERKAGYLIGLKRGWLHGGLFGFIIALQVVSLIREAVRWWVTP